MKTKLLKTMGAGYVVFAIAFIAALLVPALANKVAAGQVTSRSIQMSDSTVSASSVSYLVSFKPTVTSNIGGIVVDFCSGASTPIVGDTTCTYPAGFTMGS